MPLETGTVIEDLDNSWPLAGDPVNRGDDHLRLIKAVLQTQFPGVDGNGFKIPITATEAELNFLTGTTSNIQDQFDAIDIAIQNLLVTTEFQLSAPAGTKMTLAQSGVPAGWTQDTTQNDRYIRVVNATGGQNGGSYNWASGVNFSLSIDAHALTTAEMPVHRHTIVNNRDRVEDGSGDHAYGDAADDGTENTNTENAGSGQPHTHGSTDNSSSNTSFRPTYLDVILVTKDA